MNMGYLWWRKLDRAWGPKASLSVSHCLYMAQQTGIYQTFVSPSPCEMPSSPLKFQILPLLLSSEWHISPNCLMSCGPRILMEPPIHRKLKFSPVNLSHVNLILKPARRTYKGREEIFSPK